MSGFSLYHRQVMFSSLCNSEWWSDMGLVTCLGLMIACLCHDLDHRGTNNTFQLNTDSPFARYCNSYCSHTNSFYSPNSGSTQRRPWRGII